MEKAFEEFVKNIESKLQELSGAIDSLRSSLEEAGHIERKDKLEIADEIENINF